jgi:PiT family inorganic phosphate transporter
VIRVIFLCAGVMALGTITGGWRIMHTPGSTITRLKTHQGFAAETWCARF